MGCHRNQGDAMPRTSSKPKPRARRAVLTINERYRGYLAPHAAKIRQLTSEGKSPPEIGRILYADGVRSPYDTGPDANGHRMDHAQSFAGLVRIVLGRRPKNFREKLKQRIARTRQQLRELERQAAESRRAASPNLKDDTHATP